MGVLLCSSLGEQMRVKWKTLAVATASLTTGAILYTILFVQLQQGHRLREVSRTELEVDGLLIAGERMPDVSYQIHGRRQVDSPDINHEPYRRSISKLKEDLAQFTSQLRFSPRHLSQDGAHLYDTKSEDHSYTRNKSRRFHIKQPFHFPQPHYSRPDSFLLQSQWVQQLHDFLSTVEGNQVSLVTANQEHQDVVLNWLISAYLVAKPPVKNVLVLTLDKPLHDLLQGRGIPTLYISPGMVIDPSAGIKRAFSQVHIVRLSLVRLINNYGFDLVNYDSDAILLKNPQSYFDKYPHADMIGTFGKGPAGLFQEWGVTLNTGVLLFRSNDNIELYWESMSKLKWTTTDDQGNVNLALDKLEVRWMNFKPSQDIDTFEHEIYGVCKYKIIVMLMPFNIVCRHTCEARRRGEYYVWHALAIKENRTVENKMNQARVGGAWFLMEDWMSHSSQAERLQGPQWLEHVADLDIVKSGHRRR